MQAIGLRAYVAFANRLHEIRTADRERGLTTTEIAVLTFVLVATAMAIGTILYRYAAGRANALPQDTNPVIPGADE